MSKVYPFNVIIKKRIDKPCWWIIRQMSFIAKYALFKIIRITSYLKHINIVVGFNKHHIRIFKIINNIVIIISKICYDRSFVIITIYTVGNWFIGIVRYPETMYCHIFKMNICISFNYMVIIWVYISKARSCLNSINCSVCWIYWYSIFSWHYAKSFYMVNMFVCNKYCIYIL